MALLDSFIDVILVASGAVLGANARFLIYTKLEQKNVNKNYISNNCIYGRLAPCKWANYISNHCATENQNI